jgi:hypothetical protein
MEYKVRKSILGTLEIHFSCRECKETIICSITDAGTQQYCPSCNTFQSVPFDAELRKRKEAAFAAEENEKKNRIDSQREQEQARLKAIEQEAAQRLKASMGVQRTLDKDQDAIRTADWSDRLMWRAFRFLRHLFAFQLLIGIVLIVIGGALLAGGAILCIGQLNQPRPDYTEPLRALIMGLQLFAGGYSLYVLAAITATLVYIERNTRGILRT